MAEYSTYDLQRHIEELAKAFNILIVEPLDGKLKQSRATMDAEIVRNGKGRYLRSLPSTRRVEIKRVYDYISYAVALHELGHHCHPTGMIVGQELDMLQETSAWEWAEKHAL